jgi:uncharacterized membrane-anchored protein
MKKILFIWMILYSIVLNANQEQFQKQLQDANTKAFSSIQKGPTSIQLNEMAQLKLSKKYAFIPAKEIKNILNLLGNNTDGIVGAVTSNPDMKNSSQWLVVLTYHNSGHIIDDDASELNSDELLQSIKQGTEDANNVRKERGFTQLQIIGWFEKPIYDHTTNRVSWSIKTLKQNSTKQSVNFNTLALSREGYMSMNLVTQLDTIEQDKMVSKELLSSLNFKDGYKYSDFNSETDKIAEYGLVALITGVAAKKLGLFAVIAAFIAKFAKIIGIAIAGFFGFSYKKRKEKKKQEREDKEDNS